MRNLSRGLAAALALVLWLGVPGASKAAGSMEDAFADCSYPKTFDLMVMRPAGIGAVGIGVALFVPFAPLAALTSPSGLGEPWNTFIVRPVRFTFGRPLGQCSTDSRNL
jgi:hypothetical protein